MELNELVSAHGGERVAAALAANGVDTMFTLCGGHISPILTASHARGIHIIDVRDEATAVFAADALARLRGIPGVAAVTAGPGLTNTITALKNAQLAQSPVVLLCGAVPTALHGRGALQDIEQRETVASHVKLVCEIRRVADLIPTLSHAFAAARGGVPGPVFVECPVDLLYPEPTVRSWYSEAAGKGTSLADIALRLYLHRHVNRIFARDAKSRRLASEPALPEPAKAAVDAVVAALKKSARPLLIVGSQALAAPDQAPQIADAIARLGVPVYLSGMARGLLGRDHVLLLRHARREALRAADCVILAGVPCDFRLDYGRHVRRSSTLIAANRSRKDAELNRKPTITALGDAGALLVRVAQRCGDDGVLFRDWTSSLLARDLVREQEIDERALRRSEYVNPIALLREVDRVAGDHAVYVADGGDFVATAAYVLHPRGPLGWLDPGAFGTLGVGAGFALGAARARRDAEIWMILGDGACGYGLTEFDTFVRHGIAPIAVVGNDGCWSQIAREQIKLLHDDVGTVLARTAYHDVVAGFGAEGILVREAGEVSAALTRARRIAAGGKPVLVNVWIDRSDFREGSLSM
jgi:acetolactate synthase-1/2/3 large subunit